MTRVYPRQAMAGSSAVPHDGSSATPAAESVELTITLDEGYRFTVDFQQDGVASLVMDEPPPLGEGGGPNAARVLAASIGNCLSASALYCLRRARVEVNAMRTNVTATLVRNEAGRLRVGGVRVELNPVVAAADQQRMRRCLEIFEDFCVVTQSVRDGIDVDVAVQPVAGAGARQPRGAGGDEHPQPRGPLSPAPRGGRGSGRRAQRPRPDRPAKPRGRRV
jgi:organic hydroperoxide reductase OsmC/OhrA